VLSSDVALLAFTHCTEEQGSRFVPVTVRVIAGLPAATEVCERELTVGAARAAAGVESVTGEEFDVPIVFVTVIEAVPGKAA